MHIYIDDISIVSKRSKIERVNKVREILKEKFYWISLTYNGTAELDLKAKHRLIEACFETKR